MMYRIRSDRQLDVVKEACASYASRIQDNIDEHVVSGTSSQGEIRELEEDLTELEEFIERLD